MEEGSDKGTGQRGARRWVPALRYCGPTQTLPGRPGRRSIARGYIRRHRQEKFSIRKLYSLANSHVGEADKKEQIQTKFTPPAGQDHANMPYDPDARLSDQINLSVSKSLRTLRPREKYISHQVYLDSLLLHSPYSTIEETLKVWTHLEAFVPKRTPQIGISNVDLPTLKALWESAKVKPSIVQNRFHAETGYDVPLRAFCKKNRITYQAFWTLTGNSELLEAKPVVALAQAAEIGKPVALYALVMDQDILVLNGTTSADHMREDLIGMQIVGQWVLKNGEEWKRIRAEFREVIGDKSPSHNDPKFRGLWRA